MTTILLAAHLLAVNVASAVPLVCVWLHWRGRRGDEVAFETGRRLAWLAAAALVVGVAIGTALLFVRGLDTDREYWETFARFPIEAITAAAIETVFSLACLLVYAGLWNRARRSWLHGLWAVVAATNLLYHFPPLMVVLGTLAVRPELVLEPIVTRDVFRPLMLRPEILSQSMHFTVASFAVSALALMEVARRLRRRPPMVSSTFAIADLAEPCGRLIRAGAAIALAASFAQLFVGVWVLVELPLRVRNELIGNEWLATGLFFAAIVGTFGLLHVLATAAFGETSDRAVRRCVALMLAVVTLMTAVIEMTKIG